MNADEIVSKWEEDCKIDTANLSYEIQRNVNLYSFYLELYLKAKVKKRKAQCNLEKVDDFQTNYLKGRVPVDGKLYPYKLMADELKIAKKVNNDYQNAMNKYEAADIEVDVVSRILDQIKQRSFELKSLLEIRKLEAGE